MKKMVMTLVVLMMFSAVAFANPAAIPQANVVRIEAEDFPNVVNAEVVEFEVMMAANALGETVNTAPFPFGKKLMKMAAADASLSGEVYLTAGNYTVLAYINGPQGDMDAIYVTVNGQQQRFWSHGYAYQNGQIPSFDIVIAEDGFYPVEVTCIEVGTEIDAIEFVAK